MPQLLEPYSQTGKLHYAYYGQTVQVVTLR